ncbi:MAG: HU family DNA-binding protein [Rhodospirillales bacterium]|nr:HU family DNA-binding protein [Rhodospirillales bacterium]
MNRSELGTRVAERTGLGSSAAKGAVDAVFEVLGEAIARGEDARISGFGVFGTRARIARNRRADESLSVATSTAPTSKPGKALKDAVNAKTEAQ